jgi:predicted transcriptional regulator
MPTINSTYKPDHILRNLDDAKLNQQERDYVNMEAGNAAREIYERFERSPAFRRRVIKALAENELEEFKEPQITLLDHKTSKHVIDVSEDSLL